MSPTSRASKKKTNKERNKKMPNAIGSNPIQVDPVDQEVLASEVLRKVKPELEAMSPDVLLTVNLDIPTATSTVLGALPEIRAQRAHIERELPNFDLETFDKLEDYTLALNSAHAEYLAATEPSSELRQVVEEATKSREILLADATALVRRGLLDAASIGDLKGPVGFRNLATDVYHLVSAIRGRWTDISSKSAVTPAELERAERLQQRLLRLLGLREQSTPALNASSELRTRAYTRFIQAYDDVRRALGYLRWKSDDVESIAPSLFAGRGKRKGTETPPPATSGTQPATGATALATGTAVNPQGPAAPGAALQGSGPGVANPSPAAVQAGTSDPFLK
jgi:hypothetical protein